MTHNSGRALSIHFQRSPGLFDEEEDTSLSFCAFLRFDEDAVSVDVPVDLRFEPVLAAEPDAAETADFDIKHCQQGNACERESESPP